MKKINTLILGLMTAALLAACGGGGGSPGAATTPAGASAGSTPPPLASTPPATGAGTTPAPTPTPGGGWLTLSPSPVSLTVNQGQSMAFNVTARSSQTVAETFSVGIYDTKGLVTSDVQVNAQSQLEYVATLHTSPTLAPGTYTTNLEVRLCLDSPLTCRSQLAGSPWYLPLTITVK
jgi:hypothetical protein